MAVPPVHRLEYWRTHNIVLQPQHVGSYRIEVLGARIILDQHLPNCPLVLTSQLDMREQCLLRDRGSPQDGEQTEFEGAVVETGDCALLKPWDLRQPARAQHSASPKAITARQLQALVRRLAVARQQGPS